MVRLQQLGGEATALQPQTASLVKVSKNRLERDMVRSFGFSRTFVSADGRIYVHPRFEEKALTSSIRPNTKNPTEMLLGFVHTEQYSTANAGHAKKPLFSPLRIGALSTSIQGGTGMLCLWRAVKGHQKQRHRATRPGFKILPSVICEMNSF